MKEFNKVAPCVEYLIKLLSNEKFKEIFKLPIKDIIYVGYYYFNGCSHINIVYSSGDDSYIKEESIYEVDTPLLFRAIMMDFIYHIDIPDININTGTLEITLDDVLINQISIDYIHHTIDVNVRAD